MFGPRDATEILLSGVSVALDAAGLDLDLIEEADFEKLPPLGVSVGAEEADYKNATGEKPVAVCVATVNVFAAREVPPAQQRDWVRAILGAVRAADEVTAAIDATARALGWEVMRLRVVAQREEVSEGVRAMKTDLEITLEAQEIDESESGSESD